ncbi:TetR/AcrR family transcriptional regulator [Paenibacillus sp. UNC499MF]|uniref:TetR/AcrR family transcriptional regulator n=1 Tax=Paenibacillus sp. UNC499MF TaxID=1502751 RepID=UPI0008A03D3D|nr:TetR/AcrR family transcriptional regulator [Paenibacillus sp. UNC499MF]SEG66385.1 transcriptional regulator, TetR family [Paenibacillus sp. UNC499MF]
MSPRIGLDEQTLLRAAAELADEHGFEAVTLALLAKKLNVRSPSLYNHIEGLGALRAKLALYSLTILHGDLAAAVEGSEGDEAVFAFGAAYAAYARQHPGLYEATLRAPGRQEMELERISAEIVSLIVGVLGYYGLEGDAAIHATRGLRSILHGFSSIERSGGFGMALSVEESQKLLISAFLAGIHVMKQGETGPLDSASE